MAKAARTPAHSPIVGITAPWPLIMGIINVTPDSFHAGGRHDSATAIEHGRKLAAEGAAILDVGGESTRPGADDLSIGEELSRIIPVIRTLAREGFVVSVDTRKPEVMKQAVAAGANMINDVTALRHEPQSLTAAAGLDVPVVLMHSRGTPSDMQSLLDYDNLVADVHDDLSMQVQACVAAGITRDRLIVDPGIGFAKDAEQSAMLLANLGRLHDLGLPVLIGASRKSFIGHLTETPCSEDRLPGSIAAALWAAQQGAAILRVHDVAETVQALAIFRTLCYKDFNNNTAE